MVARARVILIALLVIGGLAAFARGGAGIAAGVVASAAPGSTSDAPVSESEKLAKIRSAFLLQIIRFTRWPEDRFDDETAPIVVGVPRGAAITPYLLGTFRSRTVDQREIVVRELDLVPPPAGSAAEPEADAAVIDAAIASCHVVYLPGRDRRLVRRTWPVARRVHVLVISEQQAHLDAGAAVALPYVDRSVRLVVNRTCLEASEVSLRSRVMKLATVVDQEVRP